MPVTHGVAGSSPVQTAKEKNISFLIFCESEIYLTYNQYLGLVVQLVRIHACHAWGRGFESRPDRKIKQHYGIEWLLCPVSRTKGLRVESVRILECHAWARAFVSRTDRMINQPFGFEGLLCPVPRANGLVVQLVRIHACHAWGRGFESRPDRKILAKN